ncbi:MAG: threonylcarbamoyl-AMP synthase [Bacteroidales bacterium]|nr:threonylcarbamoyl-AMP synthase [Bacteroidales bacterium]
MIDTEVQKTGDIILSGGIILYPTDTIWGIGCDATNRESVQNIYRIKQRTDSKSMLVLINGISMLEEYLENIPLKALDIIKQSEKPTTIIYPGARNLADNLVAPDGSIGIRITSDPFCRKLIEITGKPIVSTSANISGEQSPASFRQIKTPIREQIDYVVNWRQDETAPSIPSAIVKLEEDGTITTLRS